MFYWIEFIFDVCTTLLERDVSNVVRFSPFPAVVESILKESAGTREDGGTYSITLYP